MDSQAQALVALHTAFWNRTLKEPIINSGLTALRRFEMTPALPPEWESQDNLILKPELLSPGNLQPSPVSMGGANPLCGQVVFNTLPPYARLPWVAGIMGCDLQVSVASRIVWPLSYASDNWYELENQGFAPRLEWLDKLLEFVRYTVEHYSAQCVPTLDPVARGPGDLIMHILGMERLYLGFYDHPNEVKRLMDQITELYIRWGRAQMALIPKVYGGYCNFYGLWSPGTIIRTQSDYAINLSTKVFNEFMLPSAMKVVDAFDYPVFHTHSADPRIVKCLLGLENLKAIEVSLDPGGPPIEKLIPLWNRILEKKCLIIIGPVTQSQLDLMVSSLSPCGLMLDTEIVAAEELATAWEYERKGKSK